MTEGRGIQDNNWIQGSVDYNAYFQTHTTIGDIPYETLDISDMNEKEVADYVIEWVERLRNC